MKKTEINEKAIEDVYKNAHIALQSINDILPQVKFSDLKSELKDEKRGYQEIINEISEYMNESKIEKNDINWFKKMMLKSSISMKTLIDKSKNNISEMMIKGTVMGIIELTAMKNEKENYEEKTVELLDKLLNLEEQYEKNLKAYL